MKLISLFRKHPFKFRAFYSSTQINQKSLQLHEIEKLHSLSSNPFFHLLGICRNLDSIKKVHSLLVTHGLINQLPFQTKVLSLYGQLGKIDSARQVFVKIPEPDVYSCKVMLRCYFLNDLYLDLIEFFTHVRIYDNVVFSFVLKACSKLRDIYEGMKIHCQIIKVGNPDSFVMTGLIDMYAKCGEIECSRLVFDEIFDKNMVSWTSMIVGYVHNDCAQKGLILFNQMRNELIEGNQYTYGSVITVCTKLGALHQGKWAHGLLIKKKNDFNSFLVTNLVDMYIKCGSIKDARRLFDEFCMIDLVSWTAMIVGYAQTGYPSEALKLFTNRKWNNTLPNGITIASVLSSCGQLEDSNFGRSIHCLSAKLGLQDHTVINALIDMYAKCCMIVDAQYLFEIASDKNLIAWNSIISGYSQNGAPDEGLRLFHRMRIEQISTDAVTLVSVLSSCTSLGAFLIGSSLHALSLKEGFVSSNVFVGTALLNLYAKCGDSDSARKVFDNMREKNNVTWASMIGGYAIQGDSNGTISIFDHMLKENLEPNDVIFTCVLSACSHTGMIGEGLKYFNSICEKYNFTPSKKHYASIVDLLSRAGRLEEAWEFIENMKINPEASLYGAFLHGCDLHSRFDLGEVAGKKMLELHPSEACYYVTLYNMYTKGGRWKEADEVRDSMRNWGLIKSPGLSHVDMDVCDGFSHFRVASMP